MNCEFMFLHGLIGFVCSFFVILKANLIQFEKALHTYIYI